MNYRKAIEPIVREAGKMALELRAQGLDSKKKADGSWLTNADIEVSDFLTREIVHAFPHATVISEESAEHHDPGTAHWIIDPIDGTAAYREGKDWFAIAVCYFDNGLQFSLLYLPALDHLYVAEKGRGAYYVDAYDEHKLQLKAPNHRIAHTSRTKHELGMGVPLETAWKICSIAEGNLDAFIDSNVAYWDVCPAALVATEAGAVIVDEYGKTYSYQDKDLYMRGYVIGHPQTVAEVLKQL